MDGKQLFNKHISRLKREGVLRAGILGLAVGFAVVFVVTALLEILSIYEKPWIPLVAGACAFVLTVPVCYFAFFRPNYLDVARRLDKTGLEERVITMTELAGDQSLMAVMQRRDATATLQKVDKKAIKIAFPTKIVIACAICLVLASAGTAYYAMVSNGSVGPITPIPPEETFQVVYDVHEDGGGEILDDPIQEVIRGDDGLIVEAIPLEGYAFDSWSDGSTDPVRQEINVQEDLYLVAMFLPVGDSVPGEGEPGEGEEGEGNPPPQDGDSEKNENQQPPQSGSGKYDPANQVIDGSTFYGNVFLEYYEQAMKELAENTTMSEELREIIKAYFDILYRENDTGTESGTTPSNP